MKKKHAYPMIAVTAIFMAVLLFIPVGIENSNLSIFDYLRGKRPEDNRTATIILGGDVMLGRTVMTKSLDNKDPNYPFKNIAQYLGQADLSFVNLENPIFEGCEQDITGVSLIFCASPEMANGLKYAGIDVVTLANNHAKNYGQEGFEQTKGILIGNGIGYVGDGNLVVKKVGDINFGFLGFDFTVNEPTEEDYNLILESDNQADVLIVGAHWGSEYTAEPSEIEREWAQNMVKNGADIIAGHHPHWVQTIEEINGAKVYYSLGNLIFDQMWSEETKTGLLVKLTFKDGEITKEELIETYMQEWAQPTIKQ